MRGLFQRDRSRRIVFLKIGSCVFFDYLLMIMASPASEISCMINLTLLEVLSGIDIHIRRIPTELLTAAGLISAVSVFHSVQSVFPVFTAVLFCCVFFFFRKKIGMGTYDILLIFILGFTLQDTLLQLKFISVILILWGAAGLIIRVLKNRKDLSIPLVPLITFSFYAVQVFL